MTGQLEGKVAIVTGAGTGAGRAISVALARAGARVALLGRSTHTLEETAAALRDEGATALVTPADVGDEPKMAGAVRSVRAAWGGIDVLVCAAGVGLYGPVETYALEDWQTTIATNLTGVFLPCRAVIPIMRERGGGAIIAIGSGAGKQGYANLAAYSASKFGLIGFMESLAAEVGDAGIKVSTILPGSIMTPFGGTSLAEKERLRSDGRAYLEPEDVSAAVLFLLSQPRHAWTQELNLWPR